jgi:hypothetical protein
MDAIELEQYAASLFRVQSEEFVRLHMRAPSDPQDGLRRQGRTKKATFRDIVFIPHHRKGMELWEKITLPGSL